MESTKNNKNVVCIFCYKETDNYYNSTEDDHNKLVTRFIVLISRYLSEQSNCSTFITNIVSETYKPLHKLTNNNKLFSGPQICKNCELIFENFCNYYHKYKELALRLNFEISKLWNCMENADKSPLKVKQFEEHPTSETLSSTKNISHLRKNLKQSVDAYQSYIQSSSVPRVYLLPVTPRSNDSPPKHQYVQDFVPRVFSPINLEDSLGTSDDDAETSEPLDFHVQVGAELQVATSCQTKVDPSTTTFMPKCRDRSTFSKKAAKRHCCTLCTSTFGTKFTLDHHNVTQHPEKYFTSAKLTFVTNKQFQAYLDHIIQKTLDEFLNEESTYQCPYCYLPKVFVERKNANFHLIQNHRLVIKEKLIELQQNNAKNKNWLPIKNSTVRSKACRVCFTVFNNNHSLQRHETIIHPEIFLERSKIAGESDELFKTFVGYVTEKQVNQKFSKITIPNKSVHGRKYKYKCLTCSKILFTRSEAKYHLVQTHSNILIDKLDEIRSSDKGLEEIELELARLNNKAIQLNCTLSVRQNNFYKTSRQQKDCPTCLKKFGSSDQLRRHKITNHPELLLEHLKLATESDEMFRTFVMYATDIQVCHIFAKSAAKKLAVHSWKYKFKCSVCSQILNSRLEAKSHLVLRHHKKIGDKLVEIRNSGKNFEEIKVALEHITQSRVRNTHCSGITLRNNSDKNLKQQIKCTICPKQFGQKTHLQRHKIKSHPELFMETSKLRGESNEIFATYVAYVTEKQADEQFVKLTSAKKSTVPRKSLKYKCLTCSKILVKRNEAKYHLVVQHVKILQEKLNEVRNSNKNFDELKLELETLKMKLKKGTPVHKMNCSAANKEFKECNVCHKTFANSYSQSRHIALNHPDELFISVKSELVTTTEFLLYVKYLCSQELGKFDEVKNVANGNVKYKCSSCHILFTIKRDVRVHVLLRHFDSLAEKLVVLQRDFRVEDLKK